MTAHASMIIEHWQTNATPLETLNFNITPRKKIQEGEVLISY